MIRLGWIYTFMLNSTLSMSELD